jgi:hypothetical protein
MRDFSDLLYFLSFWGGPSLLMLVLLAFLFIAVIFRPESIRLPALFRVACILYAGALVAQPLFQVLVMTLAEEFRGGRNEAFLIALPGFFSGMLVAAAVLCALLSLGKAPRPAVTLVPVPSAAPPLVSPPTAPMAAPPGPKHPLDE